MSKFKAGDTVRIIKLIPQNSDDSDARTKFIGQSGIIERSWKEGYRHKLNTIDGWLFKDEELELVEEPIKSTEVKIDSNEITISATPFKITKDGLLAKNTVNLVEQYEQFVLGKFNKKEGNKMIESMNLIDLYANKHRESIEKETKEKIEELRKNCDVINKYNELVEQFRKDCDDLYLSQFTEEEKNEILVNQDIIEDNNMQLRKDDNCLYRYYTNKNFKTDDYFDVMDDRNKKLSEIDDLVKMVKAHVGIAKTKEEVEEILTRYGIIDKKGKLVTK